MPTPEQPLVEGGGLRSWGLARGLSHNAVGFTVALASPLQTEAAPQNGGVIREGVEVLTWTPASLPALIRSADSVVVSYCALGLVPQVVASILPSQQLVLDCNVPFHVEVSARQSSRIDDEYFGFMHSIPAINSVLQRGDVFLCASESQRIYYHGLLSAAGRLNPVTYGSSLLQLAPFGVDDTEPQARSRPIDSLTGRPQSTKLLWFGALYPWFDIGTLVEAVSLLNEKGRNVTLTIVGARNPTSTHPDFLASFAAFDQLMTSARYRAHTFVQPWVDFGSRADWFLNADMAVMINRPGLENSLAWRTRLVDLVWARLPVATNGGDPLGEELIRRGAAARLNVASPAELSESLSAALARCNDAGLGMREQLGGFRDELRWSQVTRAAARQIQSGVRAGDLQPRFVALRPVQRSVWQRFIERLKDRARRLRRRLRQDGLGGTIVWAIDRLKRS